jgi:serine/threonine-protein kinase
LSHAFSCPKCEKPLEEGPNFCPWCGEDLRGLTPNSATLSGAWTGLLIDGRYRLKEKLGEGGMGTVYKVEHVRMGKILALKVLRPDVALDKQLKQRFQQEARLVSRLSHPNTIQVFDFGELEDGSLYIAMEYLHGRDLAGTLRAHGSVSEERGISIGCQVLASLSEAHEQNIVHRDIKPANVMLIKHKHGQDLVKVLDFGIAKLAVDEQRKHITGVADFLGTPAYMSPEQARGESLDARSDLYSVGAMLFELLTGRGVFLGPTPLSIITKQMTDDPPSFAEAAPGKRFSPALEQVIRKSLAKRREDRFASADEMRVALEKVRHDWGYISGEFTPPDEVLYAQVAKREDFDRFERKLKLQRTLAPVLVFALLALAGFAAYEYSKRAVLSAPRTVEQEPNNTPAEANRIALDLPIRGMIGTPLSQTDSDRDLFVFELTEPTPLTVDLSGVRDMNLVLEVLQFDPSQTGKERRLRPLLFLDDAPTGQGEHVDALLAEAGPVYIRIQERAYFTESPRPPRETTQAWYELKVTKTPPVQGMMEIEPNDTLDTATIVDPAKPVVGFTGAAIDYNAAMLEQPFSSTDFFVLGTTAPFPDVAAAVVVGPVDGSLSVVDAGAFETWDRRAKEATANGAAQPHLPMPQIVSDTPKLIPLSRSSRGFGVRVQSAAGTVRPGSQYAVAFITDGPQGLAGAISLASSLENQGRVQEERRLLELVDQQFSRSTQIPQIRALLASQGKTSEPPP